MTKPGRRATTADIAAAVGVSRATVSFVLNDTPGQTISSDVRARVLAEAGRVGYRPDLHARALASGRSGVVLIVLPDWPVEYLLRTMLDEAAATLDEAGYSLVSMDLRRSIHARPLWETLQPDAVLSIGTLSAEHARSIQRSGARLIAPTGGAEHLMASGPMTQVAHLRDRGHARIAFAATAIAGMGWMNRGRYAEVQAAAGTNAVPTSVVTADNAPDVIGEWHRQGITGVVCFNDDVAALAVGAALRLGLRVPDDLAVVGHDDSPIAALLFPSLSTIRIDVVGLGHHFARTAIAALSDGPQSEVAPPTVGLELVVRESS
jgi:DNA-binding LacI/PurR family transcriptional regulator